MKDRSSDAEDPTPVEDLDFEAAAEELETIIDRLESGDVALEGSLEAYGRGQALLARCRGILDSAAARIAEVDLEAEAGTPSDDTEDA
ncbi:MAG: exodeoxyribonuclease VII small subunit [Phycisphaerae bacterium]|nr:exodeoxyribonuclease VII small subunit [Phycisphaerae bacterium]